MVHDNDLELRSNIVRHAVDQLKEFRHSGLILISQSINGTIHVFLGRIVSLRRLIKEEKARYGPFLLTKPFVKSQVREHMIADPIFPTPHAEKRHRSA